LITPSGSAVDYIGCWSFSEPS